MNHLFLVTIQPRSLKGAMKKKCEKVRILKSWIWL